MFGDWKVQIINKPGYVNNIIYLWRRMPDGTHFLKQDGTVLVAAEGAAIKEDHHFAELETDQLQQLANAIAGHGVRTTNDSKNEGLLQATTKHLEDMRSLVFKGKQS